MGTSSGAYELNQESCFVYRRQSRDRFRIKSRKCFRLK